MDIILMTLVTLVGYELFDLFLSPPKSTTVLVFIPWLLFIAVTVLGMLSANFISHIEILDDRLIIKYGKRDQEREVLIPKNDLDIEFKKEEDENRIHYFLIFRDKRKNWHIKLKEERGTICQVLDSMHPNLFELRPTEEAFVNKYKHGGPSRFTLGNIIAYGFFGLLIVLGIIQELPDEIWNTITFQSGVTIPKDSLRAYFTLTNVKEQRSEFLAHYTKDTTVLDNLFLEQRGPNESITTHNFYFLYDSLKYYEKNEPLIEGNRQELFEILDGQIISQYSRDVRGSKYLGYVAMEYKLVFELESDSQGDRIIHHDNEDIYYSKIGKPVDDFRELVNESRIGYYKYESKDDRYECTPPAVYRAKFAFVSMDSSVFRRLYSRNDHQKE